MVSNKKFNSLNYVFKDIFQLPLLIKSKIILFYFNLIIVSRVVFYLKSNNLLSKNIIIKHTCNSFLILDNKNCFKLSKNIFWSPIIEFNTTQKISNNFPSLSAYLPDYKLLKNKTNIILKSSKFIVPEKNKYLDIAIYLFENFSKCNLVSKNYNLITREVAEGLNIISNHKQDINIQSLVDKINLYVNKKDITFGFCHGDFHYGNIMIDNNGVIKIIDFDCVDFNGIQFFDAFYFLFEYEYLLNNRTWIQTVSNLIDNKIPDYFYDYFNKCKIELNIYKVILFFLHRIGQESIKFNSFYKASILEPCLDKIKKYTYD